MRSTVRLLAVFALVLLAAGCARAPKAGAPPPDEAAVPVVESRLGLAEEGQVGPPLLPQPGRLRVTPLRGVLGGRGQLGLELRLQGVELVAGADLGRAEPGRTEPGPVVAVSLELADAAGNELPQVVR